MSGFGDGGQPPGGGWGQPPNWGQPPSGPFGPPPSGYGQPPGGYVPPNAIVPYGQPYGGPYQPPSSAQGEARIVGVMMLVSGITNIIHGFALIIGLIWICVGVVWIFPLVVAIFEIIAAASLMGQKPTPNAKTVSILGLVAAILNLNVIGVVCQIVAIVFMGKPGVTEIVTGRSA
jgi:hypothetical protein